MDIADAVVGVVLALYRGIGGYGQNGWIVCGGVMLVWGRESWAIGIVLRRRDGFSGMFAVEYLVDREYNRVMFRGVGK